MRSRVAVAVVLAVLVAAGAGVVAWRWLGRPTPYEQAVGLLPAATLRATFTDWSAVREQAGGTSLGAGSPPAAVDRFLSRAFDRGLTDTSALTDSTYALERRFGVSPLHAQWEIYGQSREGAVDVLRVDDGVDLAGVERNLRTLGYRPPAGGAGSGGVWAGTADLVARLSGADGSFTPVQQNVVVLPDERLVLMSDAAAYASLAADVVRGDAPALTSTAGVPALASAAESPETATLWASDFACADLSMGSASDDDQQLGDRLVARAGGVSPLAGLVMAQQADGSMVVAMHFESSDQASENLQPRTDLAAGPAPGQGDGFPDRFTVTSAEAKGSEVVLKLKPRPGETLLSDLSQGPVLFATC